MYSIENSTYHVWRSDLQTIVNAAIAQKSVVEIRSHFPLDECNAADLSLRGRFLKLTGQQAQFIADQYDLGTSNTFPESPECEYSFHIDIARNVSGPGRVEYGGRALMLDKELSRNDLPVGLLLRLATPTRIRPMRRHAREECQDGMVRMPGLMLIDQPPSNRRHLLGLLAHYYRQTSRPKPDLINISAGGVCLQTADPHCQRFMGAEEFYLFFFFSDDKATARFPHVFVGKKVGIFRTGDSRPAGLRIRFLKELVWTDPLDALKWNDIDAHGSETIQKIIHQFNKKKNGGKSLL